MWRPTPSGALHAHRSSRIAPQSRAPASHRPQWGGSRRMGSDHKVQVHMVTKEMLGVEVREGTRVMYRRTDTGRWHSAKVVEWDRDHVAEGGVYNQRDGGARGWMRTGPRSVVALYEERLIGERAVIPYGGPGLPPPPELESDEDDHEAPDTPDDHWRRLGDLRDAILVQAAATIPASPRARDMGVGNETAAADLVKRLLRQIQGTSAAPRNRTADTCHACGLKPPSRGSGWHVTRAG